MEDELSRTYLRAVVEMLSLVSPDQNRNPVPMAAYVPDISGWYFFAFQDPFFIETITERFALMVDQVKTTWEALGKYLTRMGWDGYANVSNLPEPGSLDPETGEIIQKKKVPQTRSGQARGPP